MKKICAAIFAAMIMAMLFAGAAFAADLKVYADESKAAFKALGDDVVKIELPSDLDAEAYARRLRLVPEGGDETRMTIEIVEFDDSAADMLRAVRVLFDGSFESGRIYEIPYRGLVEGIPDLRVTVEDALGSVTWVDQEDGESGATEFALSTEDESEEH